MTRRHRNLIAHNEYAESTEGKGERGARQGGEERMQEAAPRRQEPQDDRNPR
jgi:hypothetical protein